MVKESKLIKIKARSDRTAQLQPLKKKRNYCNGIKNINTNMQRNAYLLKSTW